jgi:hypothetical protein
MPFSTHPPQFNQCIEILAPLCSTIYLIFSTRTTLHLRNLLSTFSTFSPSPTTNHAHLIRSASRLISHSKRQLTPFAILSQMSYVYLANSSYHLSKPVRICVDKLDWGECKDHSHPQEALLKLQWKLYAVSFFLVAFILSWTSIELRFVTRDLADGKSGKNRLHNKPVQEKDRREIGPKRVYVSFATDVSGPETIARWLWCSRASEVLMLGAGIVGGLGWWILPGGNRHSGWWVD